MSHRKRPFAALAGDARGATLPEFGFVLPIFLLLLFGIFDVGQQIYVQSVLQGAIQDAARDSGLESGADQMSAIDQIVKDQMKPVAITNPSYTIKRENYSNFNDVGQPEDFVDKNHNDQYDEGECFTDENGNGIWDDDLGKNGLGGANDVVLYIITLSYDRIFPLWRMLGQSQRTTIEASTTLRNQPFGKQAARVATQVCPT